MIQGAVLYDWPRDEKCVGFAFATVKLVLALGWKHGSREIKIRIRIRKTA
jgi:hypothetical protein